MKRYVLLIFLLACAPDLRPTHDGATGDASDARVVDSGPPIITTMDGANLLSTIDSQRSDTWIYIDLDRGAMAASTMEGWDIAFQRFEIMVNGGVSGTGGVDVVLLDGASFDSVTSAPTAGYITDEADGADENTKPDYAFAVRDAWFVYDSTDHSLSPRDRTYVLRSTEHTAIKLRMQGYYDPAGTAGFPRFLWAPLR